MILVFSWAECMLDCSYPGICNKSGNCQAIKCNIFVIFLENISTVKNIRPVCFGNIFHIHIHILISRKNIFIFVFCLKETCLYDIVLQINF